MAGKKKILVADDEQDVTEVIKAFFEETGAYEVLAVNEGGRVLEAARQFKPDLVILDLVMPGVDGSEIAVQIKEEKDLGNPPIVFSTGMVSPEEFRKHCGVIGGYPVVPKPTHLPYLKKVVETVLEKSR